MKKLKYLLLVLFLIPSVVLAAEIRKDSIEVLIHEDGSASVTEVWDVSRQNDTVFQKDFFNLNGAEISNFKIVNKSGYEYQKVNKINKDRRKEYSEKNRDTSKSYKIVLDTYKDDQYTLTYDINGIIKKYSDGSYGIDYTFVGINYSMKISNVLITVKSEVPYIEQNTALYGIGKDIVLSLTDGVITLNTYTYDSKNVIRLFTRFTDITYPKAIEINNTFEDNYNRAKNQSSYIVYISNHISIKLIIIIASIIVVSVLIVIIISFLSRHKKVREFVGIDTVNNTELVKYEDCDYYKDIPSYNLYKVGFLSSYFGISRNRSDLVAAFMLKWIYDGFVDVFPDDSKPFIRLNYDSLMDEVQLDKDLYEMLRESSVHNIIDGSKLERFASNHYLRVMTWFNMGVSNTITDEFVVGNVKRINKMGKMHLELQQGLINEATQLLGLKKYLLNFNQVPRESALTENTYKYLLIYAELFGIGDQVAKEILRKNPNNQYAKKLLDLERLRPLYRNFYGKAQDYYKQVNKNGLTDISTYSSQLDDSMIQQ